MKMYTASFKCNKTGKPKTHNFIGVDEKEVCEVIDTYCKDENMTIMKSMMLVGDNFNLNVMNMDMDLRMDDLDDDIFKDEGAERMFTPSAND